MSSSQTYISKNSAKVLLSHVEISFSIDKYVSCKTHFPNNCKLFIKIWYKSSLTNNDTQYPTVTLICSSIFPWKLQYSKTYLCWLNETVELFKRSFIFLCKKILAFSCFYCAWHKEALSRDYHVEEITTWVTN